MSHPDIEIIEVKHFGLYYYHAYYRGIMVTTAMSEQFAFRQCYNLVLKAGGKLA